MGKFLLKMNQVPKVRNCLVPRFSLESSSQKELSSEKKELFPNPDNEQHTSVKTYSKLKTLSPRRSLLDGLEGVDSYAGVRMSCKWFRSRHEVTRGWHIFPEIFLMKNSGEAIMTEQSFLSSKPCE